MRQLILVYIILCDICVFEAAAQHAYLPLKGIHSFEKEVYARARMREMNNRVDGTNRGMMTRYRGSNIDDIPEKISSMFTLRFDEDETLMIPVEMEETIASASPSTGNRRGGNRN